MFAIIVKYLDNVSLINLFFEYPQSYFISLEIQNRIKWNKKDFFYNLAFYILCKTLSKRIHSLNCQKISSIIEGSNSCSDFYPGLILEHLISYVRKTTIRKVLNLLPCKIFWMRNHSESTLLLFFTMIQLESDTRGIHIPLDFGNSTFRLSDSNKNLTIRQWKLFLISNLRKYHSKFGSHSYNAFLSNLSFDSFKSRVLYLEYLLL